MKKTWFLISCNLELNCKSYKRNRKLCFKNEKNELQKLLFISSVCIVRIYCSFVVSSVYTNLLFILRIVCPYIFTVHSSYHLGTVHSSYRLSVRIYCSFVVSSVFLLFIICCHFFTDSRKNLYLTL